MKKTFPIIIIAVLIVGAGAFYGGMVYGKSSKPVSGAGQRFGQGGGNFSGQRANGGNGDSMINGTILAKDDKSITVKLRDNGSRIIFFSDSTSVGKFVSGASADLTVGENVMVNGKANTDGSVSASNIQIRPAVTVPNPANPQTPPAPPVTQ
ncbi:MAG: DUF5666 domain-containing protein [Candidatus Parcubacteria bacterium]|nr:DUF5666 domain-containing protein [Candidatus Parcubacteria bacterium]